MLKRRVFSSDQEDDHDEGLINLTPLIDVVFVVLIVFILIAPMVEMERVNLAEAPRDKKDEPIPIQSAKIVITVKEDNSIWLNKEKVSISDLAARLKKLKAQYPKENPRLFHDRKAHFGTYQTVKNAVESCDFAELDVVLNPAQK